MRFVFSALLVATMSVLSAGAVRADEDYEPEVVYTQPVQPVQLRPFAGPYIGANAGWVRADADQTALPTQPGQPLFTLPGSDADGVAVGLHIGYSWQSGPLVVGVETDISWMDLDATSTGEGSIRTASYHYFGTVRGRLGWAFQNFLLYGTGGYAYAGLDHKFNGLVAGTSFSGEEVISGWTAGGGIEVALVNSLGPVTLRAEALYVDLEDTTRTSPPGCCVSRIRWEDEFVVARVGFSVPLRPAPAAVPLPLK